MCLAVPGKVIEIVRERELLMAVVDFGGVRRRVCLEHVPHTAPGDFVLVHVGLALARIDEAEAMRMLALLEDLADELGGEP